MAKRYLWVVEMEMSTDYIGQLIDPVGPRWEATVAVGLEEKDAHDVMAEWAARMPDASLRVVRYSAEDTRG